MLEWFLQPVTLVSLGVAFILGGIYVWLCARKIFALNAEINAALNSEEIAAALDARIKILHELDKNFDTYKIIFPTVADALIPAADKIAARKICTEIFYRRIGDPRFGDGRFVWQKVSPKSRENFWKDYLPRIGITWVVLGNNAQQMAYRLKDMRTHGRFSTKAR